MNIAPPPSRPHAAGPAAPQAPAQASANTGQTIVLTGQGFTSSTLVQFQGIDDSGATGTLTVTGTAGKTSVASFTRQIWGHAGIAAASIASSRRTAASPAADRMGERGERGARASRRARTPREAWRDRRRVATR